METTALGKIGEVLKCRSRSGFVSTDGARVIPATPPGATDARRMGNVKDVNLCTSSIFT